MSAMKRTTLPPCLAALALAAIFAAATPATARPRSDADKKTPAPSATAPALPEEYRMSPGDKLRIEVYKDAQVSQSVQVRPDGKVTLPLIGDIVASGRT